MNEALKKKPKYQKRYMEKHKMLCVLLDKQKDADIIAWLNRQPVVSDSVRKILRLYINGKQ